MGLTNSISGRLTNTAYSTYESKLEKEVFALPVPKHVAIIMDGNRRYAREVLKAENTNKGHEMGKDKLKEVLEWCIKADVRVLTVYAFSTENFSREEEEVDFLLNLIKEMMFSLGDDERIHKNKVRIPSQERIRLNTSLVIITLDKSLNFQNQVKLILILRS